MADLIRLYHNFIRREELRPRGKSLRRILELIVEGIAPEIGQPVRIGRVEGDLNCRTVHRRPPVFLSGRDIVRGRWRGPEISTGAADRVGGRVWPSREEACPFADW